MRSGNCRRAITTLDTLAIDQDPVRKGTSESGAAQRGSRGAQRARHLAHRFWEHLIRDEADYARHVEYCWINPLKHGLVTRVSDWPHSSFHRDVRAGLVPIDWGGEIEAPGDFGERG